MILDICSRLVAEDPCDVELPPVFWNRSGFFEANLTFPLRGKDSKFRPGYSIIG